MQKAVHSQKLAGYLMLHGHKLLKLEKDLKKPKYNVFVFKATLELERTMSEYAEDIQRERVIRNVENRR